MSGITLFDVVEHLFSNQVTAFFREATRVLVPGGFVLGSTPNAHLRRDADYVYHTREYTLDDLTSIARAVGFDLKVYGQGTPPLQNGGVTGHVIEVAPRFLKRNYLLKILQSLAVAVEARNQSSQSHSARIGDFDAISSAQIIFLMRKPARATNLEI